MIDITNVRPINKGDVLASCSVHLKPFKMTIHKVMVFKKGVNMWVSLPREKYETREGEVKYNDLIEWDSNDIGNRFRNQVVRAVEEYISTHGDLVPEEVVNENIDFPF